MFIGWLIPINRDKLCIPAVLLLPACRRQTRIHFVRQSEAEK
jgi:hypothetical protein